MVVDFKLTTTICGFYWCTSSISTRVGLEMSDKTLVIQHNSIVEARYRLTVEEQRLIKTLVSKIQYSDEDFKTYEIQVLEIARLVGVSDEYYYTKIKNLTKKLISNVIQFTDDNGNNVQTCWLSSAVYHKGKGLVSLRFDPILKPYLLQLKSFFTSYQLGNILRLKGMYSIRIYELLKQYEKIGRREFSVDGLKSVLGINSEYKQYRDFKKFVLAPAQNEISEKTDIVYSTTEITTGRKVVGLVFTINSREQKDKVTIENPCDNPIKTVIDPQGTEDIPHGLVSLLETLGVSRKAAETLAKAYPGEQVKAAVAYTQSQQKEGKVKNPSGFVVEAIKNGYRDPQGEGRARKETALQETKAREEHAQKWERLKAAYGEARKAMFEVWRPALSEQELAEHREKFMETLAPLLRRRKTMAEQAFLAHLKSLMPFPSLREWAGQSRLNIAEFEKEVAQEERPTGVKDAAIAA